MKPSQQWTFLFVIYMTYLMIGGGIFMALEQQHEKDEMDVRQKEITDMLAKNTSDQTTGNRDENEVGYGEFMDMDYENQVRIINRITAAYCRGRNFVLEEENKVPSADSNLKWNFYNSVYFAFSCTTTIGYGHMSPQTNWGKIFTIIFALVGIPINGALVYGLGDFFGSKLIRLHNRFKKFHGQLALVFDILFYVIPGIAFFLILPAILCVFTENWSFLDAFYFAFTSLTTIGFGDFVAGISGEQTSVWLWLDKVFIILWVTFGLGYLVMILGFITKGIKSKKLLMAIEKRLDTITVTKQKLVSEVEHMTSIVNDLYILQSQQPGYETKDLREKCEWSNIQNAKQTLLLDLSRRFSLSMPNLTHDDIYIKKVKQGRKTNLVRTKSDSSVYESNQYRRNEEAARLLTSVVSALSRKISTHVLSAVETLNKFEAEVLAQKARAVQSHRKMGVLGQDTSTSSDSNRIWNHFEHQNDEQKNNLASEQKNNLASTLKSPDLVQVVVHTIQDATDGGHFRKGASGRQKRRPSLNRTRKISASEESSRNEPLGFTQRTDYLNANYCRKCGEPYEKGNKYFPVGQSDKIDEVDGSRPKPQVENNLSISQSRPVRTSGRRSRISRMETSDSEEHSGRRKISVEQSSLQHFLQVLDNVHEKLSTDNGRGIPILEQENSRSTPKSHTRRRKQGFFAPGFSYISHSLGARDMNNSGKL